MFGLNKFHCYEDKVDNCTMDGLENWTKGEIKTIIFLYVEFLQQQSVITAGEMEVHFWKQHVLTFYILIACGKANSNKQTALGCIRNTWRQLEWLLIGLQSKQVHFVELFFFLLPKDTRSSRIRFPTVIFLCGAGLPNSISQQDTNKYKV